MARDKRRARAKLKTAKARGQVARDILDRLKDRTTDIRYLAHAAYHDASEAAYMAAPLKEPHP